MKILQVIDTLNVGGAERVFVDMCNILHGNGLDVSALFLLNGGILSQDLNQEISIIELYRKNKWSLSSMKKCSNIINQYDLIHCHFRHVYVYISIVQKVFNVKSKIVFHNHNSLQLSYKSKILLKYIFKPKYLISVSEKSLNYFKNELNFNKKYSFLLENIIIKKDKINVDKKYDLLLVSNIKQNKNNIFGVEIAEKCNLNLALIGKNQDVNYFNKIKTYKYNSIEVIENVSSAQEFLAQAELGLHTSKLETGPLVLIEYLAQGLPFLAYETGEVAKILKPHFPEYFMDNLEIDKWIEQINFLMKQNPDKEKMNVIFEKYFGVKQYFNKINEIYLCILNN